MPDAEVSYILAIDLGTSGPKVALVSTQGEIVGSEIESTELLLLPNGGAEQDPADWWAAIMRAAQRLLAQGLVPVDDIVAVSCTSQWSGTVAVGGDGAPLMNAVTWLDSRGAPYVKRVTGGPLPVEGYALHKLIPWLRLTGGAPAHSGKDPVGHILLIKHEHPDVYRDTATFLEPKDYLNLRLTGRTASSHECIVLHWVTDNRDIRRIDYSPRLLRLCGLEREKLPDLRRAVDILGPLLPEVADELGLRRDVQVVMGTPDVQSACLGSGAVGDYEAHLYVGTSSWITCQVPYKKTHLGSGIASLPSAVPGRYFVANEQETAGACLTYLRDNVLYPDDALGTGKPPADLWDILNRVAATVPPGSDKVIFTPWLYGERTPVDDHTIRAGFYNQSLATTRAHLIRAVFEGVAFNAKWLLGAVEKFVRRPFGAINMIGGGANSDLWCQIFADVLRRPIRQVAEPVQANARGAAFLAAVALGRMSFDQLGERVRITRTYEPDPDTRAVYEELSCEFLNIYKHNKRMYARLNANH